MSDEHARERASIELAEAILGAMTTVSRAARREIASVASGPPTLALATPSNLMVGDARPERYLTATRAEQRADLARLLVDPFVARVHLEWLDGGPPYTTYYFARRSAAGLLGAIEGAAFVPQGGKLGALAEYEPGEIATIEVKGEEREARILDRVVLSPHVKEDIWDAILSNFEAQEWGEIVELLHAETLRVGTEALKRRISAPSEIEDIVGRLIAEGADSEAERGRLRRKVVERIALRDRPVLDRLQGEIFRLPLDRQVILFGPPGSGKTTTLIKRLAQKRTVDALTDAETALVSDYDRGRFVRADSWAMFSPTDLLKEYLGEAFNKEGVPDAGNVRTWEKERHDLARNVFGILRSGNSGRYRLVPESILIDPSSRGIAGLHDDFITFAEADLTRRCDEALEGLRGKRDGIGRQVRRLIGGLGLEGRFSPADVAGFLDGSAEWQAEVRTLSDEISSEIGKAVNLLLNVHRSLLGEIVASLSELRGQEEEDAEDEAEEGDGVRRATDPQREALDVLMTTMRNWAKASAEGRQGIGGRSGRVVDLIGERMPSSESLIGAGRKIALRTKVRTLVRSPRNSVLGLSGQYARFRRQALREGRHFRASENSSNHIDRDLMSADELDALLLAMLRNSRRLAVYSRARRMDAADEPDWLAAVRSRYLTQVFVDEATDLSAVQLACTVELADPDLRSWFACGDLRQRITTQGMRDASELDWINRRTEITVDRRRINVGYRQSKNLRELSDALADLLDGSDHETEASRGSDEANAAPLLAERLAGKPLAGWLADRIGEVEDAVGRLPSIAVFVDGDDLVDGLAADLGALLADRNVPVAGCRGGRIVGDAREVRVFDVQHIKGLEFEAVFFVGIDRLASRVPDLYRRLLYVGLTRAATYLGIACETALPPDLESLRSHFSDEGWGSPSARQG